jgi:hypothetical protein
MGKEIIARGQAVVVCQKDGYTINQSVGEYIFNALNNGTIPSAVTVVSTIKVTSGDNAVTNFTIGTINKPTGFSSINANNTNKTITYTVAANTTTLADSGTIPIPIIIEGNTYTVSFKWAKSKNGQNGSDGKPGTDGYTVSASRNSYIVSTDKDGRIHTAVTTNTTISILKGSTPVTPTIGALPTVAGCTLSKSGATVTIVFNVGTSLAENGTISIPVVADGKSFAVSFSYAKAHAGAAGADSNMLDWVKDWNNNKTQINENSVITPKIFAGTKNSNGTLTGVAMGKFSLSVLNPSGVVTTETINGIYGFKDGYKTFYVDNTGDAGLGRGNQFIRYNATTGKIEFGSDVSLNWTQPIGAINTALGGKDFPKLTYIDGKGIYTGTLTAEQVNAVNINASSIKTGILSADRIAAGSIKSDKLDANSIKANIINTAYIQGLILNFTKGTIGGWTIDGDSIFRGTKSNTSGTYTSASGAITIGSNGIRGFKWKLDSSGAGALAGGNISWDIDGNVMFDKSVSLQWTDCIDKALKNVSVETKALAEAWQTKINKNEYLKIPIKTALLKNTTYTWCGAGWGLAESDDYNDFNESVKQYTIGIYNATQLKYVVLKNVSTILPTELENYESQLRGSTYLMTDDSFLDTDSFELHVYSHIKDKPVTASNGLFLYVAGLVEGTVLPNLQPRLTYIDATGVYTGTIQAQQIVAGTISAHLIGAESITANKIASRTITADKIQAGAITANEIKVGTITSTQLDANSIKTNIINTSYIQGLTLNFTKGKIGGWNIAENAISKNSVSLGSDGSITNGTKWKLNNDGSGQLANGNIKWDVAGTLTFDSNALPEMKDYKEYTIDATELNENTYYPVCINVHIHVTAEISVHWTLNSEAKPSWGTHGSGSYSVKVRWTTNGAGWGTIAVTREILEASQGWNNGNVVGDIGQLTNSSTEYIYVRGGGKYVFRVKNASGVPVLRSTGYTIDQQTVSPKTSVTFPVARLTKIDANGIYTGTLTASQINAANCNFTQGKIGGFTIYGHKMSTYDNPENGHIIEIHKTGYICNSRKSDSKDYWALNADGSASFGMGSTTFHASGGFVMTGNSSSKFNIDISGTNFFRVNDGSMVSVRGDGRTALSVSTYGSNNSTKGISVLCNASGYGYAIESYGNVLLNARSGERIKINGLHVSVRNIYSTASLYSNDDLVIIQQTSTDVTITLPNCQDGKIIYVKSLSSRWYNIKGTIIDAPLRNSVSSFQIKDNCARIFIKCSSGWLMFYCG